MITRHVGGDLVETGIYWSGSEGFISVPAGGGRLAGGPEHSYFKTPVPLVLLLGPLMGLAYIIFLPLSGLVVLASFLASKIRGVIFPDRLSVAHAAGASRLADVSYLEPRLHIGAAPRSSRPGAPEVGQDGKLIDLAEQIAAKRWQEK